MAADARTHLLQVNTSFTHLQHLRTSNKVDHPDFSVINLDSIVVSATLGVLSLFVLWLAARKATSGVPGASRRL